MKNVIAIFAMIVLPVVAHAELPIDLKGSYPDLFYKSCEIGRYHTAWGYVPVVYCRGLLMHPIRSDEGGYYVDLRPDRGRVQGLVLENCDISIPYATKPLLEVHAGDSQAVIYDGTDVTVSGGRLTNEVGLFVTVHHDAEHSEYQNVGGSMWISNVEIENEGEGRFKRWDID